MIFSLAQDFHEAVAALPWEHPKHRMLELFEEAIHRDIHFINRHRTSLFQCMWNRVWFVQPEPSQDAGNAGDIMSRNGSLSTSQSAIHGLLEQWSTEILGAPNWLRAEAPLPGHHGHFHEAVHFSPSSPLQAYCPYQGILSVASADGLVRHYDFQSSQYLFEESLDVAEVVALLRSPNSRLLAFRDARGSIGVAGMRARMQGRPGERAFLFSREHAIVAVSTENTLVSWNPADGQAQVLLTGVPFPVRVLKNWRTGGRAKILLVAGMKSEQTIALISEEAGEQHVAYMPHTGPDVVDADLDDTGTAIILLLKNRSIRVVDALTGETISDIHYQREQSDLTGAPLRGTVTAEGFCFVTTYGRVGCWSWHTETLTYMGNAWEKTEHQPVALFERLEGERQLMLSTPSVAFAVGVGQAAAEPAKHDGRPSQCAITGGGRRLVSISENENMIRWYSSYLEPMGSYAWPKPTCLSCENDEGHFFVGNRTGYVLDFAFPAPSQGPATDQKVSTYAITGIAAVDGEETLVFDERGTGHRIDCLSPRGRVGRVERTEEKLMKHLDGGTVPSRHVLARRCCLGSSSSSSIAPGDGAQVPHGDAGSDFGLVSTPGRGPALGLSRKGHTWSIVYVGDGQGGCVLRSEERIHDAALSADRKRICVARSSLLLFERQKGKWIATDGGDIEATHIDWLFDCYLVIVPRPCQNRVEIRAATDGLPLAARIEFAHAVSCLTTRGPALFLGLVSGHLVSLTCHAYGEPLNTEGRLG